MLAPTREICSSTRKPTVLPFWDVEMTLDEFEQALRCST
jgi:hypothetical protein